MASLHVLVAATSSLWAHGPHWQLVHVLEACLTMCGTALPGSAQTSRRTNQGLRIGGQKGDPSLIAIDLIDLYSLILSAHWQGGSTFSDTLASPQAGSAA